MNKEIDNDTSIDLPVIFNIPPFFSPPSEVLHGDPAAPREALERAALPLRRLAGTGGFWPLRAAPPVPGRWPMAPMEIWGPLKRKGRSNFRDGLMGFMMVNDG